MALIVEDGTIVANANSYNTVASADLYCANRGLTSWDALDNTDQKIPALILATDFMQQIYRTRWQGWRHTTTQTLDWPRLWVQQFDSPGNYGPYPYYYPPTVIPQQIKDAHVMLAYRQAINGDLAPDIERVEKMVKVGSIQVEYDPNMPTSTTYRAVEMLLKPFFNSSGIMSKVARL